MTDIVIKPSNSGGSVKLQTEGGTNGLTMASTGVLTTSGNVAVTGTVTGGTLGTGVTFPAGHIIQVTDLATTTTAVTLYGTWAAIGLSQSITPISSSSKILIQCQISMQQYRTSYETFGGIKLLRGSTDIFMGTMYESVMEAGLSSSSRTFLSSMNPVLYVDTGHTAGSTNTYSIQGYSGAGQCTYQTNSTLSSMLLMEIQT